MTDSPLIKLAIVVCWALAMTWLLLTKVVPLTFSDAVSSNRYLAPSHAGDSTTRWNVSLGRDRLGWTETTARRRDEGRISVQSELSLAKLRVKDFLHEFMGGWSDWLANSPIATSAANEVSLTATSTIELDADGVLDRWMMTVGLSALDEQLWFTGHRDGDQMEVVLATLDGANGRDQNELFRTKIRFAHDAFVVDAISPHPRLSNLSVGDRWRFSSYQAFPPSSAPRMSEAIVEGTELVTWDGDIESAFVVTFRDVSNHRPTVAEGPYSTLWVSGDGSVLRQVLRLATIELQFDRVPSRGGGADHP